MKIIKTIIHARNKYRLKKVTSERKKTSSEKIIKNTYIIHIKQYNSQNSLAYRIHNFNFREQKH